MAKPRKTLVFIGDSLTEYYDWERRFPEDRVLNLGIAGETAEGLSNRLGRVRERVDKPDVIFLMTGANNVAMEEYGVEGPCREIVRRLTAWFPGAAMVVQSILPMELSWVDRSALTKINDSLREIAREQNARYLDLYSLFTNPQGNPVTEYLLEDGVHLSDEGYEVWAEAVERYLNAKD